MINHVRQPLRFEDWPALFFLWELRRQYQSAKDAESRPVHFGPVTADVLKLSNLRNIWRMATSRVHGRFKNLSMDTEHWTLTGEIARMTAYARSSYFATLQSVEMALNPPKEQPEPETP
jgi:hypothetical protein